MYGNDENLEKKTCLSNSESIFLVGTLEKYKLIRYFYE